MRLLVFIFCFFFLGFSLIAQNDVDSNYINESWGDLLDMLPLDDDPIYVSYLFKGTKVVNGQSIELPAKGVLQFNIQHRFGPLSSGIYNLYGLDYAQVRFSLEYGVKDWLSFGFGRSSVSKTIDGNMKMRFKRQSNDFPLVLASNSAVYLRQYTSDETADPYFLFVNQLIYAHQVLLASKINRNLSLQITPTYIHYNAVNASLLIDGDSRRNDNISLGLGARQKLTQRISINAETFIQIYNQQNKNTISLGFDIETGGHVFQLHISNSPKMIEPDFINNTFGDLFRGDIYFGFNISRVFIIE